VDVAAWRSWGENASPELLEMFNERSLSCLRKVRRNYPADCGPNHPAYLQMRAESRSALDALCLEIEDDAQY